MFRNSVAGIGLPPEAATVEFPIELFLADSDIDSIAARKQEFYDGLMRWKPQPAAADGDGSRLIKVTGESWPDAMRKANDLFIKNLWGDGLPLWPATPDAVDRILRGSDLPRDHLLGRFPPRGGLVTVEACAIALAMAGGRPEYLPVLLAAVEAVLAPESRSDLLQAASGSAFPVVIVNGPLAKSIRLNSGFGCLGPDPQKPAGASIGRSLRLLQQNVGGALPGIGSMGIFGAMRYTNAVFAEDEEGLPPDWAPHGTERHGYGAGTDSVSVVFASGVTNVKRRGGAEANLEDEVVEGLHRVADFMRTPNLHCIQFDAWEQGTPGMVMMTRVTAQEMAAQGYTKQAVREFLWEHSRIPQHTLQRSGNVEWIRSNPNALTRASADLDPWPICAKPENIVIVVAGGAHPTNSYWLQGYCPRVMGRPITVPASIEKLLSEADRDLGCASDFCAIG